MLHDEFTQELNAQLTYLITWSRSINEIDMAGSLFGEFRGVQDGGWSTVQTAFEVYSELRVLGGKGSPLELPELRQVLCLYAQLAEAGGVYESLANLMGVVEMKPYNLWPFQELVRVRKTPHRIIGPNANTMFRRLAAQAAGIGMIKLSSLLESAFRDDIRNGIFHADYILSRDGLRLRRRNGGYPTVVSFEDLSHAVNIGLSFFQLLSDIQQEARETFRPAKRIVGRFSLNPPMAHTVELKDDGAFSISTNSPGSEVDDAFQRQERINNRLGGRVFAAYVSGEDASADALLKQMLVDGFDVLLVDLESGVRLDELVEEVDLHGLWRSGVSNGTVSEGVLLVTPSGFARIPDIAAFRALLPDVGPLEFA